MERICHMRSIVVVPFARSLEWPLLLQ